MKIAINTDGAHFLLSHEAIMLYAKYSGEKIYPYVEGKDGSIVQYDEKIHSDISDFIFYLTNPNGVKEYYYFNYQRNDPNLIRTIEELGDEASGYASCIKVIEIPDDVDWQIFEYEGTEQVHEKHRIWKYNYVENNC